MESHMTLAVIATILALFFGITAFLVQRRARLHHEASTREATAPPPQPRIRVHPASAAAEAAAPSPDTPATVPITPAKEGGRPVFKVYTAQDAEEPLPAETDDEEYVWE